MVRTPALTILLAGSMLMSAAAVAGGGPQDSYYKWRDAHGTVHVTTEPPPNRAATELKVPAEATSAPAPLPLPPATPESTGPSPEVLREQAAYRRRACSSARGEILRLEQEAHKSGPRPSDAAAKLAAEQRAQAKVRARQRMLQYCGR